jgi:hypothetical protein
LDRYLVFFRSEVDAESPTELRQIKIGRVWGTIEKDKEEMAARPVEKMTKSKFGKFPTFCNHPKNRKRTQKWIKHWFLVLKTWNLRQTSWIHNTYASGLWRLLERPGSCRKMTKSKFGKFPTFLQPSQKSKTDSKNELNIDFLF